MRDPDLPVWEYHPPYFWDAVGVFVLADRISPDGTRQHLIDADIPEPLVIANAEVFGVGSALD